MNIQRFLVRIRGLACVALLVAASEAASVTLEDALREYETLQGSKAMAVSFSDDPVAFNAGGHANNAGAVQAALDGCDLAREEQGSAQPCEIYRLNEATASSSVEIKAGSEAPHPLFMWRYQNGPSRVDLVGTIHVLKASLHPLPQPIETAFIEADRIVVEADVVNADPASVMQAFAKFALLPRGTRIEEHMDAEQLDRLKGVLGDIEPIARIKPMFIASQLTVGRLVEFGYLPNFGLEVHFLLRRGDRAIHELESVEEQFALLANVPMPDQVELLANTLDDMAGIEPMIAQLVRSWFLGDDDAMLRLFEEYTVGTADRALLETLIYERNVTMAAGIKDLLGKPGNWLVLVGAGHLPGPRGIVALLEAQGARAHRVMSDDTMQEQPSGSSTNGQS
ncbi:MAG: TraB/GumN family protein [Gammaproteobacteria bacterium]|nr:TraB/GumN family protein [Gammaproteobacteria bacterium]MDE0227114.1 TraB/GumN family protein [Gammaproteobacteria bacterium]MDE0453648.1 TraB/GumN family protein [Gammaproteobacteria bacterium]